MRITGSIGQLDDEGRGLLSHDGVTIHVAGALPGEEVEAELEHRSPHRAEGWARLLSITRPSPVRRPPCCVATGRCGGCPLGVMSYDAQLQHKHSRLARVLVGLAPAPEPIVPSPAATGYRSLAKLVYGRTSLGPRLGGYAPRSHTLIDLAGCNVVEPVLERVRALLLDAFLEMSVEPYDEGTGAGLLSYVVLRSNSAGEVLVTLVGTDLDALRELAEELPSDPALVGMAGNLRVPGNAIFGAETRQLRGVAELVEQVGPARLYLSPTAFFQVNRAVAARLYADVAGVLGSADGPIADLYCGVGGIAQTLLHAGAREVIGVELNPAAVRDATRAAEAAGLHARFVAADAGAGLRAIDRPLGAAVVNPPRKGLDDAARAALLEAAPARIAYVSCDPDTLARDLGALSGRYRVERVGAYDMHPQTTHIETLAILGRHK